MDLVFKYALFAVIAMLANIGTQYVGLLVYSGEFALYLAIVFGTAVGLLVKYALDKKYIFYYFSKGVKDDFKKFVLYSIMGIATTLIFWGFELGFDAVFKIDSAKYIGAVIGLTIGCVIKFNLDKRFVFIKNE